ncbi:hypothetical protein BX666DRAFT_847424 [Dichotomocladium elegans]|nr:hypothetical protein BX666DRAFT_847424 [Dichotomocladium elegans]
MRTEVVYAIHDFVAENEDEVPFSAGESIVVLEKDEKYMDGWWQGRNAKGQIGLFPMNYTTATKPVTATSGLVDPASAPKSDANLGSNISQDQFTLEDEIENAISHVNSSPLSIIPTAVPNRPIMPPPSGSPPPPPPVQNAPLPPLITPSSTAATAPSNKGRPGGRPEEWSIGQVADWLELAGFGNVVDNFIEQEITGDVLMDLTIDALKELGITAYGRRYKIIHAIDKLRIHESSPPLMPLHEPPSEQQHEQDRREELNTSIRASSPEPSSPPISPVDNNSLYQFPRKAPMPPRTTDSLLGGQLSSSTFGSPSVSRSNTFQTISSKISSSSSSNGALTLHSDIRPSNSRKPSFDSGEHSRFSELPSSSMMSIHEDRMQPIHPVHPMDRPSMDRPSMDIYSGDRPSNDRTNFSMKNTLSMSESSPLPALINRDRNMSVASVEPNGLVRSSSTSFKAPEHEGWLYKQGDKYKTWNKRWFVLKGANLFYFKSPKDVRMRGIIHLRGYKIVIDDSIHAGKYCFKAQHEHERTFFFYTDTKESLRSWIKVLMKATISRDYSSPVMSSNHVATVPLEVARQMRPRPPSVLMLGNNSGVSSNQKVLAHALSTEPTSRLNPPAAITQQQRESGITVHPSPPPSTKYKEDDEDGGDEQPIPASQNYVPAMSDEDEDLIDPMQRSSQEKQQNKRDMSRKSYIDWINQYLPSGKRVIDLSGAFRNGDTLIMLLEALSQKTVRRPPAQKGGSMNMQMLDNIVAAFKFMGREGVVVDGRFTIKDVFGGDEEKIMDMLDVIMEWSDRNGLSISA